MAKLKWALPKILHSKPYYLLEVLQVFAFNALDLPVTVPMGYLYRPDAMPEQRLEVLMIP